MALTIKDIKVRYKRTYLGYAWSLLNPLVYAVTYWIAFKAILNVRIEGYFVFLLAGPVSLAMALQFDDAGAEGVHQQCAAGQEDRLSAQPDRRVVGGDRGPAFRAVHSDTCRPGVTCSIAAT